MSSNQVHVLGMLYLLPYNGTWLYGLPLPSHKIGWAFQSIHMQESLDPVVSGTEEVNPRLIEPPLEFTAYLTAYLFMQLY